MEQQELDLLSIWRMLRRRIWIILALPAMAAATAGVVSYYFLTPVYGASTTLWVIKADSPQITQSDVQFSRSLVRTYAEVAKSRAVMSDVINNLGLKGITAGGLQGKLTVTPVRDTEILSFTIHDQDPAMAASLADAIAEAFRGQIRSYMKVENVVVVDRALVPRIPIKPRPVTNMVLAAVLGGLAALGLVVLLEYLDTSVKSPEDVTRHVGLPVLGMIPVIEPKVTEVSSKRTKARERSARTAVQR